MGLLDSFLSPDDASSVQGSGLGTGLSAIGMALMSGNSRAPFANLPQAYASVASSDKASTSRSALKALLMQAGYSDVEAEKLSSSEGVAKLAIQQKQQSKLLGDGADAEPALPGMGGGAAPAAPPMSPPAPPGPAASVSLNGSKTDKAKAVYEGLIQRGLSPVLAAGMTGNIDVESDGFNPGAIGDKGTAFGYHQARFDRFDNLKAIAQAKGVGWQDHDAQLDNIAAEFGGKDAGMAKAKALIEADPNMTPEKAAALIAQHGERPSAEAYAASLPRRAGTAAQVYNMFGRGAPAAQVADASGGVPTGAVSRAPLRTPGVQVANDENQTQVLEGRMSMYPPSVYGATAAAPAPKYGPDTATGRALTARQAGATGSSPVAAVDPADVPAQGAQEAGFVIPPGAAAKVESSVGKPPTPVSETTGPTTQRAQALANFNYWGKRLRASAALGDAGKGLMEEAKIKMGLAQKFLEPSEAERLADAAGLSGQTRQQVLSGAIGGNAPTSLQKEYGTYAQQEHAAGREPLSQIDYDIKLKGAGRPEQNTTIKNFANPIAKGLGDQFLEARSSAVGAAQAIPAIHQARSLLDEGVFTGAGAETKLKLGQIGAAIGLKNPKVETTEAFGPVIGQQVLANIKVLGANPSNTDRDFAEKMAGGKITLNEGSLRRIMDINEAAHRTKIKAYNESVDPLVSTADDELKPYANVLKVKEPAAYQKAERPQAGTPPAAVAGPAEGATATNRTTGAKVIFRGGQWVPLQGEGRPVL